MATVAHEIAWRHDLEQALADARAQRKLVLLDFTAAPMWSGCARLEAEAYPDPRIVDFIGGQFVPVRVHVKDQHDDFQRLGAKNGAQCTPAVLILDGDGEERHRIEGFLPKDDFLSQVMLGTARAAFEQSDYAAAAEQYERVVEQFPQTEAAPEALYWAGVSKYCATHDPGALKATAAAFGDRYQSSSWAKKASVWR